MGYVNTGYIYSDYSYSYYYKPVEKQYGVIGPSSIEGKLVIPSGDYVRSENNKPRWTKAYFRFPMPVGLPTDIVVAYAELRFFKANTNQEGGLTEPAHMDIASISNWSSGLPSYSAIWNLSNRVSFGTFGRIQLSNDTTVYIRSNELRYVFTTGGEEASSGTNVSLHNAIEDAASNSFGYFNPSIYGRTYTNNIGDSCSFNISGFTDSTARKPRMYFVYIGYPPVCENFSATHTDGTATTEISWTNSGSGYKQPTRYWLQREKNASGAWETLSENITGLSYTDSIATEDNFFRYRIAPINEYGSKKINSNFVYSNYIQKAPNDPTNVTLTFINDNNIKISWDDVNSGIQQEIVYRIQRQENGGGYTDLATTATNVVEYLDNTAEKNTNYQYRVRAENYAANSNYVESRTIYTLPTTPTTLVMEFRSKTSSGAAWSSWYDQIANVPNGKYLQIRASLTSPNTDYSSKLYSMSLNVKQ